MEWEISNCCGG